MANFVEFVYNETTTSLDLDTGLRISMGPRWRYYKDAFGNAYEGNKPLVCISLPSGRNRDDYGFETEAEAQELYDKLRGTTRECSNTCLRNGEVIYHIGHCLNQLKENGKIDADDLDRMNRMEQDGYPNPFNPSYKPPIAERSYLHRLKNKLEPDVMILKFKGRIKDQLIYIKDLLESGSSETALLCLRRAIFELEPPITESATTEVPTYHGPYHSKCIWCGVPRQTGLDCPNSCEFKIRNLSKEPSTPKTEPMAILGRASGYEDRILKAMQDLFEPETEKPEPTTSKTETVESKVGPGEFIELNILPTIGEAMESYKNKQKIDQVRTEDLSKIPACWCQFCERPIDSMALYKKVKQKQADYIQVNKEYHFGIKEGYEVCKEKLDQIRENLNQFCFAHSPAIKSYGGICDSRYITKIKAILEQE